MTTIPTTVELSLEEKKARALALLGKKKTLENHLIMNWQEDHGFGSFLHNKDNILALREDEKKPSLFRTLVRLFTEPFSKSLYRNNFNAEERTIYGRMAATVPMIILGIGIYGALAGLSSAALMFPLLPFVGSLLVAGSAFYLGIAIYEYHKTPKAERTPIQKFNAFSSIPSTLLVTGLAIAALCVSFALPGAIFAAAVLGATWLGYKVWQTHKGESLKKGADEEIEKELRDTVFELEELKKTPEVEKCIRAIEFPAPSAYFICGLPEPRVANATAEANTESGVTRVGLFARSSSQEVSEESAPLLENDSLSSVPDDKEAKWVERRLSFS